MNELEALEVRMDRLYSGKEVKLNGREIVMGLIDSEKAKSMLKPLELKELLRHLRQCGWQIGCDRKRYTFNGFNCQLLYVL